jgi:tol-pal system protein YbgF
MRGVALVGVGFCVLGACTATLERQVEELGRSLAEIRRQRSADQVRQEEISNRMLLLEDELARLRKTACRTGSPAAPTPGGARASTEIPAAQGPPVAAPADPADPAEAPPSLPVVRLSPQAEKLAEIPKLEARPLYAKGLAAFRAGELDRAIALFRAFLDRYPDHSLADNALYWSGRALARQEKLTAAVQAYETLLRRYPTGNKVPDALLALSEAQSGSGKAAAARATLARVVQVFPASAAAKEAARRLREMKP